MILLRLTIKLIMAGNGACGSCSLYKLWDGFIVGKGGCSTRLSADFVSAAPTSEGLTQKLRNRHLGVVSDQAFGDILA